MVKISEALTEAITIKIFKPTLKLGMSMGKFQ